MVIAADKYTQGFKDGRAQSVHDKDRIATLEAQLAEAEAENQRLRDALHFAINLREITDEHRRTLSGKVEGK